MNQPKAKQYAEQLFHTFRYGPNGQLKVEAARNIKTHFADRTGREPKDEVGKFLLDMLYPKKKQHSEELQDLIVTGPGPITNFIDLTGGRPNTLEALAFCLAVNTDDIYYYELFPRLQNYHDQGGDVQWIVPILKEVLPTMKEDDAKVCRAILGRIEQSAEILEAKTISEFLHTLKYRATCIRIRARDITQCVEAINTALKNITNSTNEVTNLFFKNLRALCPKCCVWIPPETLSGVYTTSRFGRDRVTYTNYGPQAHLLNGHCVIDSCDCEDLMLLWGGPQTLRSQVTTHIDRIRQDANSKAERAKLALLDRLADKIVLDFTSDTLWAFWENAIDHHLYLRRNFPCFSEAPDLILWVSVIPYPKDIARHVFSDSYPTFFNQILNESGHEKGKVTVAHWISMGSTPENSHLNLAVASKLELPETERFLLIPHELAQEPLKKCNLQTNEIYGWSNVVLCQECGVSNPVNATECIQCKKKLLLPEQHVLAKPQISQTDIEERNARISTADGEGTQRCPVRKISPKKYPSPYQHPIVKSHILAKEKALKFIEEHEKDKKRVMEDLSKASSKKKWWQQLLIACFIICLVSLTIPLLLAGSILVVTNIYKIALFVLAILLFAGLVIAINFLIKNTDKWEAYRDERNAKLAKKEMEKKQAHLNMEVERITNVIRKKVEKNKPLENILPNVRAKNYEAVAKAISSIDFIKNIDKGRLFENMNPDLISKFLTYLSETEEITLLRQIEPGKRKDILFRYSLSKRTRIESILEKSEVSSQESNDSEGN